MPNFFEIAIGNLQKAFGVHKHDQVINPDRHNRTPKHRKSHQEWLAEQGHKRNLRRAKKRSELPARRTNQRKPRPKKAKAYR